MGDRTVIVEENGIPRTMKTDKGGGLMVTCTAGNSIRLHLVFESSLGEMTYEVGND